MGSAQKLHQLWSGTVKFEDGSSMIIDKTKAEYIVGLLPPKNIIGVDINFLAIKKYGFYGDVVGYIKIKGKMDRPNLNGLLTIKNAYVQKPLNIPKA